MTGELFIAQAAAHRKALDYAAAKIIHDSMPAKGDQLHAFVLVTPTDGVELTMQALGLEMNQKGVRMQGDRIAVPMEVAEEILGRYVRGASSKEGGVDIKLPEPVETAFAARAQKKSTATTIDIDAYLDEVRTSSRAHHDGVMDKSTSDLLQTAQEVFAIQYLLNRQGHKNIKTLGAARGDAMGTYVLAYGPKARVHDGGDKFIAFEQSVREIVKRHLPAELDHTKP